MLALGIMMVPVSFAIHEKAWFFNSFPALVWGLVLLPGALRFDAMADTKAVLLGFVYGGLASVWCVAILALLLSGKSQPYDSGAYAIIQFVAAGLFLAILLIDCHKNGLSRMWVRVLTAMVSLLPAALMALQLMGYFEGLLSPLVK